MRNFSFVIDELNGGFMKMAGTIRLEGETLRLEFYKTDNVFEAYKSDLKTLEIDLGDLNEIEFKKSFLGGGKLTLKANSEQVFGGLEGMEVGVRVLKVKRKEREAALSVTSRARLLLSERRLRELDE